MGSTPGPADGDADATPRRSAGAVAGCSCARAAGRPGGGGGGRGRRRAALRGSRDEPGAGATRTVGRPALPSPSTRAPSRSGWPPSTCWAAPTPPRAATDRSWPAGPTGWPGSFVSWGTHASRSSASRRCSPTSGRPSAGRRRAGACWRAAAATPGPARTPWPGARTPGRWSARGCSGARHGWGGAADAGRRPARPGQRGPGAGRDLPQPGGHAALPRPAALPRRGHAREVALARATERAGLPRSSPGT